MGWVGGVEGHSHEYEVEKEPEDEAGEFDTGGSGGKGVIEFIGQSRSPWKKSMSATSRADFQLCRTIDTDVMNLHVLDRASEDFVFVGSESVEEVA